MTRIYLFTMLLSILPISELRGAIPYAYFNGVPLIQAALLSALCNMLVAPLGLLFLNSLHRLLDKWSLYHRFFEKTVARARKKVGSAVQKYGIWGLMLFVAVPLPITGAWTGILGAWILGLEKRRCILSICLGVLIAAVIVSTVVFTGASIGSLFTKNINI